MKRMITRKIKIGNNYIGGDAPITIQSMTNTDSKNIDETVNQINRLQKVGCEIVRMAIYDKECALAITEIKRQINVPLVADIHFDYRLAILSIENGIDKLRINPGNIGSISKVKYLIASAKEHNIPIRIGVNAGSLKEETLRKHGGITTLGMIENVIEHINILEENNFDDIVISIKASNVLQTLDCYRTISKKFNYPLHLGVTEAGFGNSGIVKSSLGIGCLLLDGIGDTIRISLTGDPVAEISVAKDILNSIGIRKSGVDIISCPTCARCHLDLSLIASTIKTQFDDVCIPLKIAVMGCVVNGPGEAKEADIGLAGGKESAVIFKKGKILRKVEVDQIIDEFVKEIEIIIAEKMGEVQGGILN